MRNNKKRGFTLVELLVVIAILAILATVSVVGYTSFITRASVSNDENVAAQLNKFLVAVKADSTGPFYGEEINEDNIWEVTDYILRESTLGELDPQAAKHGYHFYFDLEKGEYVVLHNDKAVDSESALDKLIRFTLAAFAEGEEEAPTYKVSAGNCFTKGYQYFLVDTKGDLADVISGYYSFDNLTGKTTEEKFADYLSKVTTSGITPIIDLVNETVFVTKEGNFVANLAGERNKLVFHAGVTFVDNYISDGVDELALGNGTYLLTFNEDGTVEIPRGIMLPTYSLNIKVADGKKVTVKLNGANWDELEKVVDASFTGGDVTIVLNDVEHVLKDGYLVNTTDIKDNLDEALASAVLKSNFPVTDFNLAINVVENKVVNRTDVADQGYVALDINGGFVFNFVDVNKESKTPASKPDVTWEIVSLKVNNSAVAAVDVEDYIIQDGNKITFVKDVNGLLPEVDQIVVRAKSNVPYTKTVDGVETTDYAVAEYTVDVVRVTGVTFELSKGSIVDNLLDSWAVLVCDRAESTAFDLTSAVTYSHVLKDIGITLDADLVIDYVCDHICAEKCCTHDCDAEGCDYDCKHVCTADCKDCTHKHDANCKPADHTHTDACYRGGCPHTIYGNHIDAGKTSSDCGTCGHTVHTEDCFSICNYHYDPSTHDSSCLNCAHQNGVHPTDNSCCKLWESSHTHSWNVYHWECSMCTHSGCSQTVGSNTKTCDECEEQTRLEYIDGSLQKVTKYVCKHYCDESFSCCGHKTHDENCCDHYGENAAHVDSCYSNCPHYTHDINTEGHEDCLACVHAVHDATCFTNCEHTHTDDCLNNCAACTHKCTDANGACLACVHKCVDSDEGCDPCDHVCDESCVHDCTHECITITNGVLTAFGECMGKLSIKVGSYVLKVADLEIYDSFEIEVKDKITHVGNVNALKVTDLFSGNIPEDAVICIYQSVNGDESNFMAPDRKLMLMESVNGSAYVADNMIEFKNGAWETIQFHGTRDDEIYIAVITDIIRDASGNIISCRRISEDIAVTLVNGKNVRGYSELSTTTSNVLLADIRIPDATNATKSFKQASGTTFYGNHHTFDITNGVTTATFGIIELNNANMQDTRVIGALYPEAAAGAMDAWGSNAIHAYGTSKLTNCYVANCRAPLAAGKEDSASASVDNVTVENCVFFGGRYANIDLRNGTLTFAGDVYTINQPHTDEEIVPVNGDRAFGLGVVVWVEAQSGTNIQGAGDHLTQYNFVPETMIGSMPNITISKGDISVTFKITSMMEALFSESKYSNFMHGTKVKYGNTGIVGVDVPALPNTANGDRTGFSNGSTVPSADYSYIQYSYYYFVVECKFHTYGVNNGATDLFAASANAEYIFSPWTQSVNGTPYEAYDFNNNSILPQ